MRWTQIANKSVKTRKPHQCCGCRREFPKGATMWYTVGKWSDANGLICTYTCELCSEFAKEYMDMHLYIDEPLPDYWPEANPEAYARLALKMLDFEMAARIKDEFNLTLGGKTNE